MANPWAKMTGQDDDEESQQANQQFVDGETGGVDSPGSAIADRVPATAKENVIDIRGQLAEWLKRQRAGSDKVQEFADKYGQELEDQRGQYNLSPLLAFADSINGTQTAKNYRAPASAPEITAEQMKAQEEVGKTGQPIAQDLLKEYATDNSAEAKYWKQRTAQEGKENKSIKDMQDTLFFKRGTAPEVRAPLATLNRAGRAVALMNSDALQKGITTGEMSNVATSVAGMVGGGNLITDEKLKEILPKSAKMYAGSWVQWLMSDPYGTDQKGFLDRFRNEIAAEAKTARAQLKGYQRAQSKGFIGRVSPDVHKQLSDAANEWIDTGYYNPDTEKAAGPKAVSAGQLKGYYTKHKESFPGGIKDAAKYLKGAGRAVEGY